MCSTCNENEAAVTKIEGNTEEIYFYHSHLPKSSREVGNEYSENPERDK